jgi:hypothetical protein
MLPRIVVAGRRDDALGRALRVENGGGAARGSSFALEFHSHGDQLIERLRDQCPSLVVVGLRNRRGAALGALIRRIKSWCPELPVLVACLDEYVEGREVLHAARAGAEHFVFRDEDDVGSVIRELVPSSGESESTPAEETDELGRARARASIRRRAQRRRYAERAPSAALSVLPATISPLLRRIIHVCVAPSPPATVDELASRISLPKRSLARDVARRGWPAPHVLLQWGRLFRGAAAGVAARVAGVSWDEGQWVIAEEAGYSTVRTASRAYRSRGRVGLREVWRDGIGALLPAFLAAISDLPPHLLAS